MTRALQPVPPRTPRRLSPRQRKFARFYAETLDAVRAARLAGYGDTRAARRLLGEPDVVAEAERVLFTDIAPTRRLRLIAELERIAFASMGQLAAWTASGRVTLRPSAGLTPDLAAAISEVRSTATPYGRNTTLKLHDKLGAMHALAKAYGLLTPDGGVAVNVAVQNNQNNAALRPDEVRVTYVGAQGYDNDVHGAQE